NGHNDLAPYVAANGANSFPVDLKVGQKRIQIQPGEKVCLVVIHSDRRDAGADSRPVERPVERPAPPPEDRAPARDPGERSQVRDPSSVGRVVRAEAPFLLSRSGQQAMIAADKAAEQTLRAGDEVRTPEGR